MTPGPAPAAQVERERAPESVHSVVREPGERLPADLGLPLRDRLGAVTPSVRLHTGPRAAASAEAVRARAYTVGSHVVLGRGERVTDRELLTHELTHVARAHQSSASIPTDLRVAGSESGEERAAATATVGTERSAPVMVYRQAVSLEREQQVFVEQTIRFLGDSARYYADEAVTVNPALVSRVLDSWHRMVVVQGEMGGHLRRGVALTEELRTAYTGAVRTLLGRAATATGTPLAELYRVNEGRIPPWAWLDPAVVLPGISTPVPVGSQAQPVSGAVDVSTATIAVSVVPDDSDPGLGQRAETRLDMRWRVPAMRWEARGRQHVVTSVDPVTRPTATIQTFYGRGITATSRSGYGRGTTTEDVAGAAVAPRGGTVGFHEGEHGRDLLHFMQNNRPPVFGGRVGMTVAQFHAASEAWQRAMRAYQSRATQDTLVHTDCTGHPTIDDWERGRAGGRRVRLVCPAR